MKAVLLIVAALMLSACGGFPHVVKTYELEGVRFVEHKDHPSPPERCGEMHRGEGCSVNSLDGKTSVIYYSALSPPYVLPHEQAHGLSMRHTPWTKRRWNDEHCATIAVGYKHYKAGDSICVDGRRERTYRLGD